MLHMKPVTGQVVCSAHKQVKWPKNRALVTVILTGYRIIVNDVPQIQQIHKGCIPLLFGGFEQLTLSLVRC